MQMNNRTTNQPLQPIESLYRTTNSPFILLYISSRISCESMVIHQETSSGKYLPYDGSL